MAMPSRLLLPFLLFILLSLTTAHKHKPKEKYSHLHLYFHDSITGRNATAVPVTKLAAGAHPQSYFGIIAIMDDPLTEGPELNSTLLGRAQGLYAATGQEEVSLLMNMNLAFTAGEFNGSVLTVLGRNQPLHPVREMPIVGGTGLFRFARGYVLARTHWLDLNTLDATVEYDVHVIHYGKIVEV